MEVVVGVLMVLVWGRCLRLGMLRIFEEELEVNEVIWKVLRVVREMMDVYFDFCMYVECDSVHVVI